MHKSLWIGLAGIFFTGCLAYHGRDTLGLTFGDRVKYSFSHSAGGGRAAARATTAGNDKE